MEEPIAMKAIAEFVFFFYQNGAVEAYHKIDNYWDDIEPIRLCYVP